MSDMPTSGSRRNQSGAIDPEFGPEPAPGEDEVIFVAGAEPTQHGGIGVTTYLKEMATAGITVGLADYLPGASTGEQPVTHEGTEFLLLLEGIIVAEVDGREYRLEPGCTLRFPASKPHRGWNPGNEPARALFIYL
jgi:mannose-6-phosphate isomerase-like protein (cupin superfamily)